MADLKVLDLFSGIGGFSLGLERAGRFARIPEMEARILSDAKKIEAADELAKAVSNILAVGHPVDLTSRDCLERVHCALNTALEVYRKAGGDA